ncbi:hypothetical protein BJQ89_00372 [Arthrobacter sp. ES1]|nr:hypothetical protein [Arthrobacter sp. ES1]
MGVDLGGGQATVAQDFLHGAEVGPAVEQVRGGRVPEGVRSGGCGVPQSFQEVVDDAADLPLVDPFTARTQEQRGTGGVSG